MKPPGTQETALEILRNGVLPMTWRRIIFVLGMLAFLSPADAQADQESITHKGIRLIGSVHADISNKPFFDQLKTAIDLADKLPPRAKRAVFAITDIVYNPQSRMEPKNSRPSWQLSAKAYYLLDGNPEQRRIVTVLRNLKYRGAPATMLTTLVHEGSHALQDLRYFRQRKELQGLQYRLGQSLAQSRGSPSEESLVLEQKIRDIQGTIVLWYEGPAKGKDAHAAAFECEAAMNAVLAAQALGLGRSQVGAYASICPKVKKKWYDLIDDRAPPNLTLPPSGQAAPPASRPIMGNGGNGR